MRWLFVLYIALAVGILILGCDSPEERRCSHAKEYRSLPTSIRARSSGASRPTRKWWL